MHIVESDLCAGHELFDRGDDFGHRDVRTSEVEDRGTVRRRPRGRDEGSRDIRGVLELCSASERDVVRLPRDRGGDRLGGTCGHTLVTPGPVDDEGAKAQARESVVLPEDPGDALGRDLVDAVK